MARLHASSTAGENFQRLTSLLCSSVVAPMDGMHIKGRHALSGAKRTSPLFYGFALSSSPFMHKRQGSSTEFSPSQIPAAKHPTASRSRASAMIMIRRLSELMGRLAEAYPRRVCSPQLSPYHASSVP